MAEGLRLKNDLDATEFDILGYEKDLGNPASNGNILSSTTAGVRSWIAPTSGTAKTVTVGTDDANNTYDFPATAAGLQDALNDISANDTIIIYEEMTLSSVTITMPSIIFKMQGFGESDSITVGGNLKRISIDMTDLIFDVTGGEVFLENFDFFGSGTSGFIGDTLSAENCSFQNEDSVFGAMTFGQMDVFVRRCFLYDASLNMFVTGLQALSLGIEDCDIACANVSFIQSTGGLGEIVMDLVNVNFSDLTLRFIKNSTLTTNSDVTATVSGYNRLPVGTTTAPIFEPVDTSFQGFWAIGNGSPEVYPELFRIVVSDKGSLLEKYYPFQPEVAFDSLPGVGSPTAYGSGLQWDATVNGCVTMEYVITTTEFGQNDFGASGSLRIVIQGSNTSLVFLNDENRMEVNIGTPVSTVFSVDVVSVNCRLLYTGQGGSIHFFNIKHTILINTITP